MDNVINFPGTEFRIGDDNDKPNLDVSAVLQGIQDNDVNEVFVVGLDPNGELYLASNVPSLSKFVFLLELAKLRLLNSDFEQQ